MIILPNILIIIYIHFRDVSGAVYTEDHRKPAGQRIDLDAFLNITIINGSLPEHDDNSTTVGFIGNSVVAEEAIIDKVTLLVPNSSDTLCAVEVNSTVTLLADKGQWSPTDTSNPQVKTLITSQHNVYRRKHPATNMLEMSWNEEAATLAQDWADKCFWNHSDPIQRTTSMFSCGQNIARADYQMSWNATLHLWYHEMAHFKFDQNPTGVVGDFTQMLWAQTWQVGCGYKFCPDSGEEPYHLYVCNYCPAGNIVPVHYRPFDPALDHGRVCDHCGGPSSRICNNGLCTNYCNSTNSLTNCEKADGNFPALFPDGCATSNNFEMKSNCSATCECKERGDIYCV